MEKEFSNINTSPIKSISVKPITANITSIKKPEEASDFFTNISSTVKNVKHDITNLGRRDTHIDRSNSFVSKTLRFVQAPEYIYVATNWDRFLIMNTIIVSILSLILFFWILTYKFDINQKYIYKDKEKNNEDLNKLNMYSDISSYIKIVLGFAALISSIMQIRVLYKHNTFRRSDFNRIEPINE